MNSFQQKRPDWLRSQTNVSVVSRYIIHLTYLLLYAKIKYSQKYVFHTTVSYLSLVHIKESLFRTSDFQGFGIPFFPSGTGIREMQQYFGGHVVLYRDALG